jgi:serine/threonine-protein kinase RsbW/stage II sporulation protein AB (anti-sigma F factor)
MTGYTEAGQTMGPLQIALPSSPESVTTARRAVAAYARSQGADSEGIELAVSEAVTNAVVHAYAASPDRPIRVTACLNGDAVLVSVEDEGEGIRARVGGDRLGLGLALIAAVADSMFVESKQEGGTRVVMRFRWPVHSGPRVS